MEKAGSGIRPGIDAWLLHWVTLGKSLHLPEPHSALAYNQLPVSRGQGGGHTIQELDGILVLPEADGQSVTTPQLDNTMQPEKADPSERHMTCYSQTHSQPE